MKARATKVTDFKPISLITILYKLIDKVLAKRLKKVLHQTASICLSALIDRRLILDLILIANELLRWLCGQYLDFEKAYDMTGTFSLMFLNKRILLFGESLGLNLASPTLLSPSWLIGRPSSPSKTSILIGRLLFFPLCSSVLPALFLFSLDERHELPIRGDKNEVKGTWVFEQKQIRTKTKRNGSFVGSRRLFKRVWDGSSAFDSEC